MGSFFSLARFLRATRAASPLKYRETWIQSDYEESALDENRPRPRVFADTCNAAVGEKEDICSFGEILSGGFMGEAQVEKRTVGSYTLRSRCYWRF